MVVLQRGNNMYLERVCIKNFRCFDAEGIIAYFNKGVNAIIGENNTGKSALIDALRIAFSTVQYQRDIYFRKSDFHIDLSGMPAREAQFDLYFAEVPMELIEIWMPESNNHGEFHIKFYLTKTISGDEKVKYTAWGTAVEGNTLSSELFDAIDVSYLGALRDAEDGLRPSRNSKLAELLGTVVDTPEKRQELIGVLGNANQQLLEKEYIRRIKNIINDNLDSIEQEILAQRIDVGFTEPRFEAVASSIRSWVSTKWIRIKKDTDSAIQLIELATKSIYSRCIEIHEDYLLINVPAFLKNAHENGDQNGELEAFLLRYQQNFELRQNGLGYNNLIYMSTILGDMSISKEGVYHNLLLIEEPEAHLHPQLQELIYDFFQRQQREDRNIQIVFTTHSPTLVSKIELDQINLLYEKNHAVQCMPLATCEAASNQSDKKHLKKYLDVTKSQMFFAKGLIFVEGISEALLLPSISNALGRPLDKYAVEVINVDGLSLKPFAHLLYRNDGMPAFCKAAIITDDDRCCSEKDLNYISPALDFNNGIDGVAEKLDRGTASTRFTDLQPMCTKASILLCGAKKTLEYELAFCEQNIDAMVSILKELFPEVGVELEERVRACTTIAEKQILVWLFVRKRNKCKAELAQAISELIDIGVKDKRTVFYIPEYLKNAIYYVTEPLREGNEK